MKVGLWKRTLLAGALAVLASWPVATFAAPTDSLDLAGWGGALNQFSPTQLCATLGSNGMVGSATAFGGLSQLGGLGSGGFYGAYYNPAYGSQGFGSFGGGYLNYRGGQPTAFSTAVGSPYCAGVAPLGAVGAVTNQPCIVTAAGLFGTGGSGFGTLPFGGINFAPYTTSPFAPPPFFGGAGSLVCR
jgi:hypothetical protein